MWSGKKKGTRVQSMLNQEVIECFITKVNDAQYQIQMAEAAAKPQHPWHVCMSPNDHYHIAALTRQAQDLAAWLGECDDDPAIEVHCSFGHHGSL